MENVLKRCNFRRAVTAAVLVAMCGVGLAHAQPQPQTWPQRAVKLMVPFGAGSATDTTARLFADRLSRRWGQPVVVENKPGGDSNIAAAAFVSARDDHVLLYSAPNLITVNPILYEKLPYNPSSDLVPISSGSEIFLAIAVPASLGINTLAELIERARAQPGKLNWVATPGVTYFMFAGFLKDMNADIAFVPYRDFTQAMGDLSEGRIQVAVVSLAVARPLMQAGKVKVLAVPNRQRNPLFPDIPTVAEAGFAKLTFGGFGGFFGWKGMPNELRDRIAADIRQAGADPEVEQRLQPAGIKAHTGAPSDFAAEIEDERAKVATIAKALNTQRQ
jgi:tripartite-type tricarboxylate transporter receptor subunit TctC